MTDRDDLSLAFLWDTDSNRFSRRAFLGTMAFAGAAGFLAACGSSGSSKPASGGTKTPPTAAQSTTKTLNFYNWTDYIADDTIPNFQKQTGIKVTYDNYSSNDDLLAKMQGGVTGYDIVVPTDAYLVRMQKAGLLEPINLANIPNVKNLDPRFRDAPYDPGNQYSIPWQWGTTGIGYDKTKVKEQVTDWNALQSPEVKGRASFLNEARDAFAMALFALGKDPNTSSDGDLDAAKDYLVNLKKNMKTITSDYQDPLKNGELVMAHAYSGDVFTIEADNDHIAYVIPTSGAFSWVDSMAIPKGAKHIANVEAFMNYMLEPKVGAALTNAVNYGSPNKAAEPFINKDILDNPLIYPSQADLAKLPFQKTLSDEDELKYSDRWTEVKNFLSDPADTETNRKARRRLPDWLAGNVLLLPTSVWFILLLIVPSFIIIKYSLGHRGFTTPVRFSWSTLTFQYYRQALSTSFLPIFQRSVLYAVACTILCVLLGFPLAYWIARFGGRFRNVLIVLVIIPFLTSYLIRIYAWQFILQREGLLNSLLGAVGLGGNHAFLNTHFAVILGLTYGFLPFMILPLYATIERMDHSLVEASYDLGGGKVATFLRVILPATMPGLVAGVLLVFIPAIGDFVTPELLGGTKTTMYGQSIADQFGGGNNWPLGSAMSVLLMLFILLGVYFYLSRVGEEAL